MIMSLKKKLIIATSIAIATLAIVVGIVLYLGVLVGKSEYQHIIRETAFDAILHYDESHGDWKKFERYLNAEIGKSHYGSDIQNDFMIKVFDHNEWIDVVFLRKAEKDQESGGIPGITYLSFDKKKKTIRNYRY
jgi:hypothetical protein